MAYRLRQPGMWGLGEINHLRLRGLGQANYSSYMTACTGGGGSASCSPFDQICIANAQNVVDACNAQYVSDPNSPHNNANNPQIPSQPLSGAALTSAISQAGGSIQLAEQAAGETTPPDVTSAAWWGAPNATVAAPVPMTPSPSSSSGTFQAYGQTYGSTPAPTPTPPVSNVMSSSAVPITVAAQPAGASLPAASQTPAASSGFSLSSIPTWGWLAAAAVVGLMVFSQK